MQIAHADEVIRVDPGTSPNYSTGNPLQKLLGLVQRLPLAAEREHYWPASLQHLIPFERLELYGPNSPNADVLDPRQQDDKQDFQKQNLRDFDTSDTTVTRGWVTAGGWTGLFLHLSYRGGPDSQLSRLAQGQLGESIKLWLQVGDAAVPEPVPVPYNETSDRYEVEFWGYGGDRQALRQQLDHKGRQALDRGELRLDPDLVPGSSQDFAREAIAGQDLRQVAPANAMHPILPLHLAVAWADASEQVWDSRDGQNYQFAFNMILRGWEHFLQVGQTDNPHGGIGTLEFRNLLSNYFAFADTQALKCSLPWWSLDAFGRKGEQGQGERQEPFFPVNFMDLHALQPDCGIGLHRHRDNQEIFFMLAGRGLMVVGDWCQFPERERCFEVRTLSAGHLAMLSGGQLHALMNVTDETISLLMLGSYD